MSHTFTRWFYAHRHNCLFLKIWSCLNRVQVYSTINSFSWTKCGSVGPCIFLTDQWSCKNRKESIPKYLYQLSVPSITRSCSLIIHFCDWMSCSLKCHHEFWIIILIIILNVMINECPLYLFCTGYWILITKMKSMVYGENGEKFNEQDKVLSSFDGMTW